jgi:hypothetical protein
MPHRWSREDDVGCDRHFSLNRSADRAMRRLESAGLTHQPIVRVLTGAVKRHVQPSYPKGTQMMN